MFLRIRMYCFCQVYSSCPYISIELVIILLYSTQFCSLGSLPFPYNPSAHFHYGIYYIAWQFLTYIFGFFMSMWILWEQSECLIYLLVSFNTVLDTEKILNNHLLNKKVQIKFQCRLCKFYSSHLKAKWLILFCVLLFSINKELRQSRDESCLDSKIWYMTLIWYMA